MYTLIKSLRFILPLDNLSLSQSFPHHHLQQTHKQCFASPQDHNTQHIHHTPTGQP